ncbi:hypothetical protein EUX98_g1490 [Antrodiella citrinella]|uniref:ubiquitinyl hydrolase 1 n=1 Tax=Antrodiella citrinella TaxID=2447956 RepID=A0A4V3XJE6_9APHY|nr:hypothetical protein EUX98_g1490 [Antrodiella citrinella]
MDAEAGDDVEIDLVGAPFAVLESDPGLFTMLLRKLGVEGLEVTEVYDIAPWAIDHLNPRGLIFCYLCPDATESGEDELYDGPDLDAEDVWFAHQLTDDACASQALLNVIFNCEGIELGDNLNMFLEDTRKMSPEMKGLSITNSSAIRDAHNSFARPVDVHASRHAAASKAAKNAKRKAETSAPKRKTGKPTSAKRKKPQKSNDKQDSFHFIGYVPCGGKVWELDGLRFSGPLEVGDVPPGSNWTDVVRPALRMRMQRYISADDAAVNDIRYSLLAIVDDKFCKASDEMEMLKRERLALERRLQECHSDEWSGQVDKALHDGVTETFTTSAHPASNGPTFSKDFGSRKMEKEIAILDMPVRSVPAAWEKCVQSAMSVKMTIDEEVEKSKNANVEHINRVFDYEPFFESFITSMHNEGLLTSILSPHKAKKSKRPQPPYCVIVMFFGIASPL